MRFLKTFGLFVVVMGSSFIIGVLIFNFIVMPLAVGLHREVNVPDVCEKEFTKAKEMLDSLGLEGVIASYKFSELLPEGYVISQTPLPSRRVKKGKKIKLILSKGEEKVSVPYTKGLLLEQAKNLISSTGLGIKEIRYICSEEPKDEVVKTIPVHNTLIPKSSEIILIVSNGEVRLTLGMPELTGKTLKESKEIIEELKLFLGKVEYTGENEVAGQDEFRTVDSAIVLIQFPMPGAEISIGDTVNLIAEKRVSSQSE